MADYEFRQCEWDGCRFRFPVEVESQKAGRCPRCGAATSVIVEPSSILPAPVPQKSNGPVLSALVDNVRSIHNVGSIFRTADGARIHHLYLCGITATPANLKLGKAALGAQEFVSWTYERNGVDLTHSLKKRGHEMWAVEVAEEAEPFFTADLAPSSQHVTIVVGNERAGVDPGILSLCDRTFYLPMAGQKRSLNVAVAFGIVCYHLSYTPQSTDNAP